MVNIHDSGYKVLFSNRTIFRQLIETFVSEDWVAEADFERAKTVDKSFISDHYKTTESDLIYKVPLRDSEVYIYVLLEFQSGSERFMALRVLNYLVSFYMDYQQSHEDIRYLPPVFPIVLYNGNARWTAPTRFEELIELPKLASRFGVSFEYFKIAENEFRREDLLRIRNIVSTLFLAESHYDSEILERELATLFSSESDRQAVSLFINWFIQLAEHGRIKSSDVDAFTRIYSSFEEVRPMLIESLKKEKEKIRQEIRQEIREEERTKEKRQIASVMLDRGMAIEEISEITGLTVGEIREL